MACVVLNIFFSTTCSDKDRKQNEMPVHDLQCSANTFNKAVVQADMHICALTIVDKWRLYKKRSYWPIFLHLPSAVSKRHHFHGNGDCAKISKKPRFCKNFKVADD